MIRIRFPVSIFVAFLFNKVKYTLRRIITKLHLDMLFFFGIFAVQLMKRCYAKKMWIFEGRFDSIFLCSVQYIVYYINLNSSFCDYCLVVVVSVTMHRVYNHMYRSVVILFYFYLLKTKISKGCILMGWWRLVLLTEYICTHLCFVNIHLHIFSFKTNFYLPWEFSVYVRRIFFFCVKQLNILPKSNNDSICLLNCSNNFNLPKQIILITWT